MLKMTVQFPEVTVTATGFRLAGGKHEPTEVQWSDVVEITAYKWDVFAYDVICLGIRLDGTDEFIEVGEDFPGYNVFIEVVETRFPLAEGWWRNVAFPAFATNWSTIWGSEVESNQKGSADELIHCFSASNHTTFVLSAGGSRPASRLSAVSSNWDCDDACCGTDARFATEN